MAFRVKDAKAAHERALELGATNVEVTSRRRRARHSGDRGHRRLAPVLRRPLRRQRLDLRRRFRLPSRLAAADGGRAIRKLTYIDHLTHNVNRGRMAIWADFYERLFNFREIRYFDIEGKQTGLFSKAMTSPCGKIRIPLNESQDDKSQIEEFLREYKGEGIQHIALGTVDIYAGGRHHPRPRHSLPGHARHLLRDAARAHQGP